MSFRRRLLVGQATALAITIANAVIAIVALEATTRSADRVTAQLVNDVALAEQLRFNGERLVATSRGYLLNGEDDYLVRARGREAQLDATLERIARGPDHVVSQIERDAHAYIDVAKQAESQRALASDPRAVLETFDRQLEPRRVAFERDVDGFVALQQARYEAGRSHAHGLARGAQAVLAVTSAIAVVLSVGLGVLFVRTMTRHFHRVEKAAVAAQSVAAAREELIAVVSHDLRSPLQAIMLNARLLGRGDPRHVDAIGRAAASMRALLDDLLDTARVDGGALQLHRERCDAERLLAEAVEAFASTALEGRVALTGQAPAAFMVEVDRQRILQILSNLIGNALRFVSPGGSVTVTVAGGDREARFAVTDTGSGIPADQLSRVFERYYRSGHHAGHAGHAGLGLGLYICRQLVEAHRGQIGVESVVGAGTTFWFTIPAGPAYLT